MTTATNRRVFVAGAAGAALLGPLAWRLRGGETAAADGITVVPGAGGMRHAPATVNEAALAPLRDLVGESFQLATATGAVTATLSYVGALPVRGARPASLRQQPFFATFSIARAVAPTADGTFSIDRAIDGLSTLFMTRGADHLDRTTLTAIFA